MKRYIILFAISVLAFASCSKDDSTPALQERSGISIDVICSKMTPSTKDGITGTKPGDPEYNENIIKTIDYYFYPEGKEDQPSVLHARLSPNALNQHTVNVPVDEDMINTKLFPRPSEHCTVAVLVNYPGEHPATDTKLVDIQNLSLVLQLTEGSKPKGKDQSEFVMFGIGYINHIERRQTVVASLEVGVHRVAAKLTLDAHISPKVLAPVELIDGSKTYILKQEWVPSIDEMGIYLENGNSYAFVSGDAEAAKPYYNFFKYDQREFSGLATHTITTQIYTPADYTATPPVYPQPTGETEEVTYDDFHKSKPFYTYPQTWDTGSEHEPFLKLVLPWTRLAGNDHEDYPELETPHSWTSTKRNFYYRILLPNNATGFVSNNWYHINLDVEILGSDIDDATVEIEGKYYVVDWGSADPVTAEIKGAKYLSVSKLVDTMYNVPTLKIPYVTSNKCSLERITVKQKNFSGNTETYTTYYNNVTSCPWVTLDENNNIEINHPLNNDVSTSNFDVAPYEFTFRIRHEDEGGNTYYRDITIIQYPAMYIELHKSNYRVYVNSITGTDRQTSGKIWDDDGSQNNYYNAHFLGVVNDRNSVNGSGANNNQNQYTIHVTVLEGSSSYIGDPRIPTGTTLDGLSDCTNYRPTAETSVDVIAPVFRIASSYGKTNQAIYESAQKRCAAYQENGYPAGRWRLPTKAEIEYLITLSSRNKIPTLFGSTAGVGYWAAGGYFYVANESKFIDRNDATLMSDDGYAVYRYPKTGNTYYAVYTRCVYDEWYWGDKTLSTPNTWGGFKTGINDVL